MNLETYKFEVKNLLKKTEDLKKVNLELTRELLNRGRERDFYKNLVDELLQHETIKMCE